MSIPVQLHLGVMKSGFFCLVWFMIFFSPMVELIHSSTLPMQIYGHLYLGTGKKKVCGIVHLHCSSPRSSVID